MTPPASHDAVAMEPHQHICLHEDDWSDFREFKAVNAQQVEADRTFRMEIISEIKGLRTDVTDAMAKMGEYLGMGKLIKFGIGLFASVAGATAAVLGAGHALGWW